MGVINKLKGRMSGYNALTKGPARIDQDFAASTGFDDKGFKSGYRQKTTGSDAVSAGIRAGQGVGVVDQTGFGEELAQVGENVGKALAERDKPLNPERREFIDKKKKEEGKTPKEARQDWRAHKKQKRELNKALKKLKKQDVTSGDIVSAFTNYPLV